MTPFLYPKIRHARTHSPSSGKNNRFYKPILKQEFAGQCVYCRLPDAINPESFGVDHYRPKRKFPELASLYSNLFYCCNSCNSRKHDFWPLEEEIGRARFIPNPCDDVMFSHMRYLEERVECRTVSGSCAIEVLGLNDEQELKRRHTMLLMIDGLIQLRTKTQETIAEMDRLTMNDPSRISELELEGERSQQSLQECDELLHSLTGGRVRSPATSSTSATSTPQRRTD